MQNRKLTILLLGAIALSFIAGFQTKGMVSSTVTFDHWDAGVEFGYREAISDIETGKILVADDIIKIIPQTDKIQPLVFKNPNFLIKDIGDIVPQ